MTDQKGLGEQQKKQSKHDRNNQKCKLLLVHKKSVLPKDKEIKIPCST